MQNLFILHPMKIAITGASGFLGSVLIPLLLEEGHSLRLLIRNPSQRIENWREVEYVTGALPDETSIRSLVEHADVVVHLAALISLDDRPDKELFRINTEGSRLLLAASKRAGVKRFIHLSSVTAYNQAPYDLPMNEDRPLLAGTGYTYDHSKAAAQAIALSYNGNGMEVIVLAPAAILGPQDQKPSLLGAAIIRMYQGRLPALFPGGVDFVDVRDVAGAIVNALTRGVPGQAYLLGGEWASLVTLCRYIGSIKGKKILVPVLPLWLVLAGLPVTKLWTALSGAPPLYTRQSIYNLVYSSKMIDHSRAGKDLLFQPRPLTDSLRDIINWFKQTGQLK